MSVDEAAVRNRGQVLDRSSMCRRHDADTSSTIREQIADKLGQSAKKSATYRKLVAEMSQTSFRGVAELS